MVLHFPSLNKPMPNSSVLEQALKQVADDSTFRKVKRMSYSGHAVDSVEVNTCLAVIPCLILTLFVQHSNHYNDNASPSPLASLRNSAITSDLNALDNIISSLSHRNQQLYKSTLTAQLVKSLASSSSNSNQEDLERNSTDSSGTRMPTIPEQRTSTERAKEICQRLTAMASRGHTNSVARRSANAEELTQLTQNVLK